MGMELPNIAVQTVLSDSDVAIGTSLVVFARSLGGAIFIAVGENVFSSSIVSGMHERVPDVDPSVILQSGATDLQNAVGQAAPGQADVLALVLDVYNDAIVQAFAVALALACISIIGTLGVEFRTVKGEERRSEVKVDGGV